MPATASKGPVAPSSKKERSGSPQKPQQATALVGDIPPAKVLEHSDKAAEAEAATEADTAVEDTSPNPASPPTPTAVRTLPQAMPRGFRRESSVLLPTKPGEVEVVLSDRLLDPLTNQVTAVLQPVLTEEEAEAAQAPSTTN